MFKELQKDIFYISKIIKSEFQMITLIKTTFLPLLCMIISWISPISFELKATISLLMIVTSVFIAFARRSRLIDEAGMKCGLSPDVENNKICLVAKNFTEHQNNNVIIKCLSCLVDGQYHNFSNDNVYRIGDINPKGSEVINFTDFSCPFFNTFKNQKERGYEFTIDGKTYNPKKTIEFVFEISSKQHSPKTFNPNIILNSQGHRIENNIL